MLASIRGQSCDYRKLAQLSESRIVVGRENVEKAILAAKKFN